MYVLKLSLKKEQFFMSHKIRETDMPALLDDCVTNALSGKMLCPQKISSSYTFVRTQHAYVLVYWGLVNVFLSPVKL